MTVIAAQIDEGTRDIYIAADTDSLGEETYYRFVEPKVRLYTFPDGSQLGMGGAGDSQQTHCAFDYAWEKLAKEPFDKHGGVDGWLGEFAAQWTQECNAMEPTAKDDDGMLNSCFILGYQGVLYRMQQWECRALSMSFAACGAGVHYAMGALYAMEIVSNADSVDRVKTAAWSAISYDKFCNGHVEVIRVPYGRD